MKIEIGSEAIHLKSGKACIVLSKRNGSYVIRVKESDKLYYVYDYNLVSKEEYRKKKINKILKRM